MAENGTMIMQIREVPAEVHAKFRIYCFQRGVSMNKQLLKLLTEFVANIPETVEKMRPEDWVDTDK